MSNYRENQTQKIFTQFLTQIFASHFILGMDIGFYRDAGRFFFIGCIFVTPGSNEHHCGQNVTFSRKQDKKVFIHI